MIVGCSSAGEFSGCNLGCASASLVAIRADDILFQAGLGRDLRRGMEAAVAQVLPAFTAKDHPDYLPSMEGLGASRKREFFDFALMPTLR
jgi:hypothetical protein